MKTLFYNGTIMTMEPDGSRSFQVRTKTGFPEALLVEDSRIKDIGSYHLLKQQTDSKTRKIDLNKKILLPGFIDNHTHFFEYLKEEGTVDLQKATSLADIESLVKEHLQKIKEAPSVEETGSLDVQPSSGSRDKPTWVFCRNLEKHRIKDYSGFNVNFLDSISRDHPLVIQSKDYHTRCCNSLVLRTVGIDRNTPDTPGGKIGRYADGNPDGFLYEKAWKLLEDHLRENDDPQAGYANVLSLLPKALNKLHSYGITGVHTMEGYANYQRYKDIFYDKLRVCWHIFNEDIDQVIENNHKSYTGSEFQRFGTVKTFLDGSLGSTTALLSSYQDKDSPAVSLLMEEDDLRKLLIKCRANGLGLSVHSIGDLSTTIFLDVVDQLYPAEQVISPMIRLEHLQFIDRFDLQRIKKRGIYSSLQPYHVSFDIAIIESLYPSLREIAYPFTEFFEQGCELGFGSDSPVADINPFAGIYSAVTRKADLNPLNESWTPQYRLEPEQALFGYTHGAAYGSLNHSSLGSLKPGKLADMIVIDDYRQQPPEFWLQAHSYLTMVHGRILLNELTF